MFNPGDIEIRECMLSGIPGSVDISRRIHDFKIYENIKKPYTSIEMTIIDNADIINNNIGLDATNNFLSLSFGQPGQPSYTGRWAIMSIEKGRNLNNQRTAIYKIIGYSPHMTKFPKVQKAYKNQTATNVAKNLIQQYLSPEKALQIGAPSRGILGNNTMPFNINGIQIHKAIRSTLLRAASTVDPSSAYVFFENQHSMVIDTLENLLNKAFTNPRNAFYQRPMGKDFLEDVARQPFIILSLREESRQSRPASIQDESQAVNTLDMFSNVFKKGNTQGSSSYLNIPYNLLRPPTYIANFLDKRKKIAGEFDSQSVTIHVSFNQSVTVGEGFTVETIAPAGDTDQVVLDRISGPLLCTEVCHSVILDKRRMQGTTTAKGVKGPNFE